MIHSTKQQKKNYADIREQVTNKCNVPNVFNAFPLKIQQNLYRSDMGTVFHYSHPQLRVVFHTDTFSLCFYCYDYWYFPFNPSCTKNI